MEARLERVGTSSLTVALRGDRRGSRPGRSTRDVCRATFTMVTADDGRAVPVRLRDAAG